MTKENAWNLVMKTDYTMIPGAWNSLVAQCMTNNSGNDSLKYLNEFILEHAKSLNLLDYYNGAFSANGKSHF